MKRVHPNLSCTAIGALVALSMGNSGCRSTSGSGGLFLSPDRVPPPSTRALLPGQAQPYYPGDPLPVMQSAANPPTNAVATNQSDVNARSESGRTLAWTPPGSTPTPTLASVPAPSAAPPPQAIVAANEASVAVPTDTDPLRFALPAPREPENVATIPAVAPQASVVPLAVAAQPAVAVASPTMVAPRAVVAPTAVAARPMLINQQVQPSPLPPPPQPQHGVMLASYNAPATNMALPPAIVPPISAPQQVTSPWRSPQVAQPTMPPYGMPLPPPPVSTVVQQQVAIPANAMNVTMRAVPSPPPQPGDPMPRVRVPGYIGAPQFGNADGFRPRTSMQ